MTPGSFDAGEERLDVAVEEGAEEGACGVDGEVDGGGGELAFGDEVEEPGVEILIGEEIRGFVVEAGEIDDEGGVGLDGSGGLGLEGEELDEFMV